jgi:hypothetical protein
LISFGDKEWLLARRDNQLLLFGYENKELSIAGALVFEQLQKFHVLKKEGSSLLTCLHGD